MPQIIQDFIQKNAANRPGRANPMLYVTIHNTGAPANGANAKAHANYIKGAECQSAPKSWHYTVDDAVIYQHIPDNEDAFHAGDGNGDGNRKSIGIEVCMNADGDLRKATDNAAWLTARLCREHNIPIERIKQHYDWSGKGCPERLRAGKPYDWQTFLREVRARMTEMAEAENQAKPSDWAKESWAWGAAEGITDGTNPKGAATREMIIAMIYRAIRKT